MGTVCCCGNQDYGKNNAIIPGIRDFRNLKQVDNIRNKYEVDRQAVLGQGSFGKVLRATHLLSQKEYAMKIIKKISLKSPVMEELMS